MKYRALVFDLDDTLIDTRFRHYKVLEDYLLSKQVKMLDFPKYISIRKEKKWSNESLIKNCFDFDCSDFKAFWQGTIESEKYLAYDAEIVNTELLNKLKIEGRLDFILLSLRSKIETATKQFRKLSFSSLFDEVFFIEHASLNPKASILQQLNNKYLSTLFIGDAETDALAANDVGVDFWGVSTGIYPLSVSHSFSNINQLLLKLLHDQRSYKA